MELQGDYFEILIELTTLKLEINSLKDTTKQLEKENKFLKTEISSLAMENSNLENLLRKKNAYSALVSKKWQFYRDNKEKVQKQLRATSHHEGKALPWTIVKKATDALFASQII